MPSGRNSDARRRRHRRHRPETSAGLSPGAPSPRHKSWNIDLAGDHQLRQSPHRPRHHTPRQTKATTDPGPPPRHANTTWKTNWVLVCHTTHYTSSRPARSMNSSQPEPSRGAMHGSSPAHQIRRSRRWIHCLPSWAAIARPCHRRASPAHSRCRQLVPGAAAPASARRREAVRAARHGQLAEAATAHDATPQ